MLTTDAIKYFGSKKKLAEAAGVKAPTVYAWGVWFLKVKQLVYL